MVKVTDPGGRTFSVRESSIRTVTSEGGSLEGRRFFLLYKSGRRREVDYSGLLGSSIVAPKIKPVPSAF